MTSIPDNKLELLRSKIMDHGGIEEKVEVNQRHLIDKILARYSAEYVLYRELMQNADDASSSAVQIHFQTNDASLGNNKQPNLSSKCNKIIFKNNGMVFRPEDWQRLKRIAEGNPDEQKIGAFGVGFYSLFSICENPFVSSGSQCMAFYFKGDQLFAKRADIPTDESSDKVWTSFLMDLREPMEMPNIDHFTRFLTTSMGFTANLKEITVYFDQQIIFRIRKREAEPRAMSVDAHKMLLTTVPAKMFTLYGADIRPIQLDAEKYTPPSIFSPLANLLSSSTTHSTSTVTKNESGLPVEKGSIFLRVVTGSVKVNVSQSFEKEMERSTKKKPPKMTKIQLVYTGKDELDASENKNQMFRDLIPFPHQGRVFIGFPTHQTTGYCCHMAARFIPTVERESIDFADRYISLWNKELLVMGGLLARLVYNDEMEQIRRLYGELVGHPTEVDKSGKEQDNQDNAKLLLEKKAGHALRSFTFQPSTPSGIVSQVQEEHFFKCCKVPLDIMTSHGVRSITVARTVPDITTVVGHDVTELLNSFIKTIPTVTWATYQLCKDSIDILKNNKKLLLPLGVQDVLKELDQRSLKPAEMVACMKWWIECFKGNQAIPADTVQIIRQNMDGVCSQFLQAAIIEHSNIDEENSNNTSGLLQLSQVRWWLNPKLIPLDMPVPDDTLPFSISKHFSTQDLARYFGSWHELNVGQWLHYITELKPTTDKALTLENSKEFAERVLHLVSRQYGHLSKDWQVDVVHLLQSKSCIPTKLGMKFPQEAYFPSVNLFGDLPTLTISQNKHMISPDFLKALGVREDIELQLVFDRLISGGSWSHVDLVKHLISRQSLSKEELRRLRETAIFSKEGEAPTVKQVSRKVTTAASSTSADGEDSNQPEIVTKEVYKRYLARDLFTPTDIARRLQLPVIDWPSHRWRQGSEEAKLLEKLGLNDKPPLPTLLACASPPNPPSGDSTVTVAAIPKEKKAKMFAALNYLVDHYQDYASVYDANNIDVKFIPCVDRTYASPRACFTNPDVQLLGFSVIHPDLAGYRDRLGVRENPNAQQLVQAFLSHSTKFSLVENQEHVRKVFEYMATRMSDISTEHWRQLQQFPFIPILQQKQQEDNSIPTLITTRVTPSQCYFETENSTSTFIKELFTYVNFGQLANSFLCSCGVRDEPTTVELATMLVKNPQRLWELSGGGEKYLGLLREIASQSYSFKNNKQLLRDMKSTAFLVGIKRVVFSEEERKEDNVNEVKEEENSKDIDNGFIQYTLAKASDIFISDDPIAQQLFSPLSAPMEPMLEEFYRSLGSAGLHSQIREAYSYKSNVGTTNETKKIAQMIFERTPIILYQILNDNPERKNEFLHDEKYLKQHLKVIQVNGLKITRTFKHTNEKSVQPTTSCVDRSNFIIYISDPQNIDYNDVAQSLCNLIFARIRTNDTIIVERYLTTSLMNLRRKGIPVDRILNLQKQQQTRTTFSSSSSSVNTARPNSENAPLISANSPSTAPTSKQLDEYTKQVQEVFPDCQEGYIRQLLTQQKTDHSQNVIDKLLHDEYPKVTVAQQPSVISEEKEEAKKKAMQKQQSERQTKPSGLIRSLWSSWKQSNTNNSSLSSTPMTTAPSSPADTKKQGGEEDSSATSSTKGKLPPSQTTITPQFTENIKQNLKRAIHSCKPYEGQTIYTPPRMNEVREAATYCDSASGKDLVHAGNVNGIEFYIHRSLQAEDVLDQYGAAISRFKDVLVQLSQHVFELRPKSVNIFYDTAGPTIAFNLSGSLFMNLRYYLALHDSEDEKSKGNQNSNRGKTLIYWFMTICHELAHNFIGPHNSEHEFYMSSFAENYIEQLMLYMQTTGLIPSSSNITATTNTTTDT
ncbi:hypothetical protein BDF20DRAFT_837459 [Mycotypha africana]|uniref:uncharacterized protein n=1 Tax=Mycotypha africana TaxID=64632 RepID=UPI002300ED0D|nr:uncharacterized protein BDF20DRAFT_837459 [Mycotypha africana]KAI8973522.1 hypothetical protein BDF20DRAFT_837459 [Mycotypha africana]